jgi:hypothetical protein
MKEGGTQGRRRHGDEVAQAQATGGGEDTCCERAQTQLDWRADSQRTHMAGGVAVATCDYCSHRDATICVNFSSAANSGTTTVCGASPVHERRENGAGALRGSSDRGKQRGR